MILGFSSFGLGLGLALKLGLSRDLFNSYCIGANSNERSSTGLDVVYLVPTTIIEGSRSC